MEGPYKLTGRGICKRLCIGIFTSRLLHITDDVLGEQLLPRILADDWNLTDLEIKNLLIASGKTGAAVPIRPSDLKLQMTLYTAETHIVSVLVRALHPVPKIAQFRDCHVVGLRKILSRASWGLYVVRKGASTQESPHPSRSAGCNEVDLERLS